MVEREPARTGRRNALSVARPTAPGRRFGATRWDAYVITGALVLLSGIAWAYVAGLPDDDMSTGVLTRPRHSMPMPMPTEADRWGWPLGVFVVTWTVMMVAMMFPATAPVVLVFDRWRRSRSRSFATTAAFVSGYLVVWAGAGAFAYALVVGLETQIHNTPTALRLGGAVLIAAGLYQASPLKAVCLNKCRSPLGLVMEHAQQLGRGVRGPFRIGLVHGAFCLGCCWALMAVLIALGVMHLGWMAGVSALILAEKLLPGGRVTAYVAGGVLGIAGVTILATAAGSGI